MAQRPLLFSLSRAILHPCAFCIQHPRLACFFLISIIFFLSAVSAIAQSSQQYLYGSTASQLAGFSTVSSGALTSIAGTPFSDPQFQGGMMAIDGKGQFLFLIDHATSGVWMFQIHSDGTLARAPGSPFFAPAINSVGPAPSSPLSLATELSGQFVYVGYQSGYSPGDGAIVEFQISVADPANPQLAPVPAEESSYLPAASPLQMLTDPKGTHLYVTLRGTAAGGTNVYAIDSTTGAFTSTGTAGGGNANEQAIALDPSGQFFFDSWGSNVGFIESAQISPAGTTIPLNAPINLGPGNIPRAILVDGLGKFLYVDVLSALDTYVYPIDPTGNLSMPPLGPETAFNFQTGTAVADPQGPYIYSLQPDGLHAFVVDATTGAVSDVVGSPFSVTTGSGTGIGGLAISGASGQAVTGALAQLFPPTQDFGMVFLGQTGVAKPPPNLTNTGSVGLNLTAVSVTGANAADFIAAPVCSVPAFLPSGTGSNATCSINVTFAPTAMGPRQAILTTTTDTAGTQSTILTGIGIGGQPAATLAPASLTYPSTVQGATSAAQTLTLTSSGAATLHISSVVVSGANPGDFMMTSGCSGAIAANATCSIGVTFSPLADGLRNAAVSIADDAPGSPQIVPMTGTGAGSPISSPAVTITPTAISFAATGLSSVSASQSVSVKNSGTAGLHISLVQVSGVNAPDFAINNACTAPVYAANATCVIAITFTPSATGARAATLTITDDATGGAQTIALTGTGIGGPAATISTAAISFAAVAVGTKSPQQNITITNTGTAPLHFSPSKLSGPNAGDFSIAGDCTAPAYAVNTACTVSLTFTPSASGTRGATLTITDDAANSPQTVTISGNANLLFSVTPVAGGSLSATVAAGTTATFNLQLTTGFNGSVSFTCTGAPVSATCSVPTTIAVTSGVPSPLVVTVATTGSGTAVPLLRMPMKPTLQILGWQYLLLLAYLLCGMFLYISAARNWGYAQRPGMHWRLDHGAAFVVMLSLMLCTMTGCGGGNSVAQSAPTTQLAPTPTGTSAIIVTPIATPTGGTPLAGIPPIQLMLTVD